MKMYVMAMVAAAGFVAGCAATAGNGDTQFIGNGDAAGARLIADTEPTSKPAKAGDMANSFSQGVFSLQGRGAEKTTELTRGWMERPVKFEVQHPFDLKLGDRFSYDAGSDTADVWVLGADKAHLPPPNRTTARTELRLIDPDYLPGSGEHMMECDMYIVPGTFACITQVFAKGPMAMMVVDAEGTITDLRSHAVIGKGMNGKWFHWTVVHDSNAAGKGAIKIYVDGKLADGDVSANKSTSYYFKVGVYSRHGSDRSEVKIRDLRVWQKGDGKSSATP